jgi:hypothetical protein
MLVVFTYPHSVALHLLDQRLGFGGSLAGWCDPDPVAEPTFARISESEAHQLGRLGRWALSAHAQLVEVLALVVG